MSELEPDYKCDKAQSSGSNMLYTVEARYAFSKPVQICGQLFDMRWSEVRFKTSAEGIGVPELKSWSQLSNVSSMYEYVAAQALRWWFHAEAAKDHSDICLETRLIKHEIKWSQTITAVSQHCKISGEDRSNIIPDWGQK